MYTKHIEGDGTKIVDKTEDVLTQDIVNRWQVDDVTQWLTNEGSFATTVIKCFQLECIDGSVLLNLTENDLRDFRYRCGYDLRLGEIKKLWQSICNLQHLHIDSKEHNNKVYPRFNPCSNTYNCYNSRTVAATPHNGHYDNFNFNDYDSCAPDTSSLSDGCINTIPPEFFKTGISMAYSFLVTWITSFVMVIVHERVPDMKRYPPLPDIFLDNVPHIPWAFNMCEITGTLLFVIWLIVCIFHKYRMVLLRRFFALAGTVFLLRCVTMLITSLSVPGTHLQCNQKDYAVDDSVLAFSEALYLRISRAYVIWSGLGMSIQGVRTCGDYMFSGHTVTLTLLNFFITEYTPRHLYFLHTLTWLLNMFGIFFILAAHEHYSIDVFVAFYITSRLFLYYHTLANNQALMQRDSTRTRIWFPMFSYFESSVNGIIPNEYDSLSEIADKLLLLIMDVKDLIMLTANRVWLEAPSLPITASSTRFLPYQDSSAKLRNAATSTNNWTVLNNIASNSTANSEILAEIENYSLSSKASGLKIGDINNKSLVTQKLESVTKENTSLSESKKPLKKSVNLSKFEQSSTTTTTTTNNNNNNNRDSSTIVATDFSKKHL